MPAARGRTRGRRPDQSRHAAMGMPRPARGRHPGRAGGADPGLAATLRHAASMHNPLFYERQRMRASTFNIPRFLHSYDETLDGGLILPRGMLDTVTDLAAQAGSRLDITDERTPGTAQQFTLTATLKPPQRAAVTELARSRPARTPGKGSTALRWTPFSSPRPSPRRDGSSSTQWRPAVQPVLLVFGGRDVTERAVKPLVVEPAHPPGGGRLGLVQADDRLGQGVVVTVPFGPYGGDRPGLGQPGGVEPSPPGQPEPVLAAVKATPCGRPAAGLDSGRGPASDNQRRERPEAKTHKTTRSASRENRVSTKPGAVQAPLPLGHVPCDGVMGTARKLGGIPQRPRQVIRLENVHDLLGRLHSSPAGN